MATPFERFFSFRRFQPTLAFTADGESVLFSSDVSGQFNLWRVDLRHGAREQLTAFDSSSVREIAVRRQDGLVVFTADTDGDEFHALYELRNGEAVRLSEPGQVQHFISGPGFSPDGTRLAYAANAREPETLELFVRDPDGGEPHPVFSRGNFCLAGQWHPDGRRLLALELRSNSDYSIHLVDVDTGSSDELTPADHPAKFEAGPWAGDGSGFWLLTDVGAEYTGLAFYDLARHSWSYVEQPRADVLEVAASPDGGVLLWTINDRGFGRVRVRDTASGRVDDAALPEGSPFIFGSAPAFAPDGRRFALLWDRPRRPPEVYVADVDSGDARRVTDSAYRLPPDDELVQPELVAIPGERGDIPAWLYRAGGDGAAPAVMYVHGGPESQVRAGYLPIAQYLVSRGISVIAPNIRGSTGYGKTYQRSIYRDWGHGDLADFRAIGQWLLQQEWVDGTRLGVCGGSYGGFATLLCLSRLPDVWSVGVDVFGPSNLISLIATAPPTWYSVVREMIGDPDRDREKLLAGSPLTHADAIRAPLLVVQGAKDPRVVPAESEQLVERLRDLGRDVDYVLFDDEGHGFTRHENELRGWRLLGEFLERHLVGA